MAQYHLLTAIAPLSAQIRNSLLNEIETAAAISALVQQTRDSLVQDRQLKHDLIMVESLVVLKHWGMAMERLQEAIMGTYMR
jgi:hypothetical protein